MLYEFWSVATRPADVNGLGMTPAAVAAKSAEMQSHFRLLRDERGVFDVWEELVSKLGIQGKQAHDARIVAAMQRHNISHLLTFNVQHFARYQGIAAVSPQDVVAGAAAI